MVLSGFLQFFIMQKEKFRISSPSRSSARWTESINPIKPAHVERTRGGDKEKGFQKGRTLRGGRSQPLVVLLFCPLRLCRCLERSQQLIEARFHRLRVCIFLRVFKAHLKLHLFGKYDNSEQYKKHA